MTLKTIQRSGVPSGFQKRRLSPLLQQARWVSPTALGRDYPEPWGCDHHQVEPWGGGVSLAWQSSSGRATIPGGQKSSTKGRARGQRGLFSAFKISQSLPCFHGTHPSFPLSHVFHLEWERLSCACPTTVLWKHLIYLVSLVHSWRGVMPQDDSQPYLIEMIFG